MTVTIRAHFDGKVIVPDQPVALPQGTPLTVSVTTDAAPPSDPATLQGPEQRAAFEAFLRRAESRPVPRLADDATRREGIYED